MRIISGKFRGKKLNSPPSTVTRPTSDRARETIFNMLEHNPALGGFSWKEKRILDVFAGSGALGLEALSRGAKVCVFIDSHRDALRVLRSNINSMGLQDQTQILEKDATHLPKAPHPFQVVFMDPPYQKNFIEPVLEQLLKKGWVEVGSLLVIESEKKESFQCPQQIEFLLDRTIGAAKMHILRVGGTPIQSEYSVVY